MTTTAVPIPMAKPPTDARPILFCPFCRECFEGEKECPEHELALVPFEALPKEDDPEAQPSYEEVVAPLDPRFGRGIVMAGIAASLIGFAMPVIEAATGAQSTTWTGLEIATERAHNLWTVPFVAAMFAWILARRRTPIQMLGARLVGIVCALAPLVALAYTWLKVEQGARQYSEASGQVMAVAPAWGLWVMIAGAVLLVIGSARLGVIPGSAKAARGVAERLRSP